jgi:hypothetical protein
MTLQLTVILQLAALFATTVLPTIPQLERYHLTIHALVSFFQGAQAIVAWMADPKGNKQPPVIDSPALRPLDGTVMKARPPREN